MVLDVVVKLVVLAVVELVTVGVAVLAAGGMADFGAAGDDDGAGASLLQNDSTVDRAGTEALVGSALGVALGGAATGGAGSDTSSLQLLLSSGLGHLGSSTPLNE